jgi:sugar phosphate isomerase/epimerase
MSSSNIDDFAVDSRLLAGSLTTKLSTVRAAGFAQIVLSSQDLVNDQQGLDAAIETVQRSQLRVSGLLALSDFEGLTGPMHAYKLEVAKSMLDMCAALACPVLIVRSSTLIQAQSDPRSLVRSLRQLALLAIPKNIKIAYQGISNGVVVKDFLQAWDVVCDADMPNLGLSLDTYDMLVRHPSQADLEADLEMLDSNKLFLVQLADHLGDNESGFRVLPGDGDSREVLAALVCTMHKLGYRGHYSLAAFNADYDHLAPQPVAQRARVCAQWLGQDVLQRSVPLPNQIRLRSVASTGPTCGCLVSS